MYTYWTTEVHGLTRRDTDGQPTFPEVWAQVAEKIKGLPLVAHNRPFDESCLKAVFEEYDHTLERRPLAVSKSIATKSCIVFSFQIGYILPAFPLEDSLWQLASCHRRQDIAHIRTIALAMAQQ